MSAIRFGLMREWLLDRRGVASGWGYRPLTAVAVEPTVLAALALAATLDDAPCDRCRAAIDDATSVLAEIQQADGALGVSADVPAPHWGTALGLLLWSACDAEPEARRRAADWLLGQQGLSWQRSSDAPLSHDPSIPGWAWVEGTHSWLEPTAWAVLALGRSGHAGHPRVAAGQRLIRDRALRPGGWNYGNSRVFGTDLRPQPGPSGLALLALAGADDPHAPHIDRTCAYLARALPATRAPQSLCWGLLGLAAWGGRPADADGWLESAAHRIAARSDRIDQMAYLLLAAAPQSLALFGISPGERTAPSGSPIEGAPR